jgi:hypothetical protein
MQSGLHESFVESIGHEVTTQLAQAGESDDEAAEFSRKISNVGSGTLTYESLIPTLIYPMNQSEVPRLCGNSPISSTMCCSISRRYN